jgi:hypothetical protein
MLPNARRDVQTEQNITRALGLIGHPHGFFANILTSLLQQPNGSVRQATAA